MMTEKLLKSSYCKALWINLSPLTKIFINFCSNYPNSSVQGKLPSQGYYCSCLFQHADWAISHSFQLISDPISVDSRLKFSAINKLHIIIKALYHLCWGWLHEFCYLFSILSYPEPNLRIHWTSSALSLVLPSMSSSITNKPQRLKWRASLRPILKANKNYGISLVQGCKGMPNNLIQKKSIEILKPPSIHPSINTPRWCLATRRPIWMTAPLPLFVRA